MKTLVVFYSRTRRTKTLAQFISSLLNADVEWILEMKERSGFSLYFFGGMQAKFKKGSKIKQTIKNPSEYDLIVIGTPIWAGTMTPAIRTYLSKNGKSIKKIALFSTAGGDSGKKAFKEISKICGKEPIAVLELNKKEVDNGNYVPKAREFVLNINKNFS